MITYRISRLQGLEESALAQEKQTEECWEDICGGHRKEKKLMLALCGGNAVPKLRPPVNAENTPYIQPLETPSSPRWSFYSM